MNDDMPFTQPLAAVYDAAAVAADAVISLNMNSSVTHIRFRITVECSLRPCAVSSLIIVLLLLEI